MAELDFDELDRAVNSLMSQAPVSVPAKQDDDVTTVELPDDVAVPDSATPSAPSEQPVATVAPAPAVNRTSVTSTAPVEPPVVDTPASPTTHEVKPRRGRFMDMIHPSVAKENADKLAAPSARPSREAKTIEPHSGGLIADIVKKPTETPEPAPADEAVAPASEVAETAPEALEAPAPEAPVSPSPTGSDFSAFLPDAKVEKRPLGQPVATAPTIETPPAEPSSTPAVEEYDQQLMAIESGNAKNAEPVSETPAAEMVELPVAASEINLESQPASSPEVATAASEPKPTGPTSIAQQYQEQPSSSDQSNGAIYDTATYHQPLSHPAKKSSGWLWVILIIAIILIGAGAGAYLYLNNV